MSERTGAIVVTVGMLVLVALTTTMVRNIIQHNTRKADEKYTIFVGDSVYHCKHITFELINGSAFSDCVAADKLYFLERPRIPVMVFPQPSIIIVHED